MAEQNLESQLADLRRRISAAQAARARAQVEHDHAVADRDQALDELRRRGVTSSAEVTALVQKLESAVSEALDELETQLKEAGV